MPFYQRWCNQNYHVTSRCRSCICAFSFSSPSPSPYHFVVLSQWIIYSWRFNSILNDEECSFFSFAFSLFVLLSFVYFWLIFGRFRFAHKIEKKFKWMIQFCKRHNWSEDISHYIKPYFQCRCCSVFATFSF